MEGTCESNDNIATTAPGTNGKGGGKGRKGNTGPPDANEPAVATPDGICERKGGDSSGGRSGPSEPKRQRVTYVTALRFDPFYREVFFCITTTAYLKYDFRKACF